MNVACANPQSFSQTDMQSEIALINDLSPCSPVAPRFGGHSTALPRHHLLISGTGRAGTTFLVQLLTELGLDTGFQNAFDGIHSNCRAGMEYDIRFGTPPYVIKSPFLCDHLDDFLENAAGNVVIDHLFVPVRDLYAAAESRRDVTRRTDAALFPGGVPGGLWMTDQPERQEQVLLDMLYKLVFAAAKWEIAVTLLHFPRTVHDPVYLYEKLSPALKGMDYDRFLSGFQRIAKPGLVHEYGAPASVETLANLPAASYSDSAA
jgi:hypothetical protein